MFLITWRDQGTPEQHKLFFEKPENLAVSSLVVSQVQQGTQLSGGNFKTEMQRNVRPVRTRYSIILWSRYGYFPCSRPPFALHFTGRGMMALHEENQKKMAADAGKLASTNRGPSPEEIFPSTDLLADLHPTSCGLIVLPSTTAAEGLEVCRRACGGHGYSSFSSWYADYLPTTTYGKASDNDSSTIFKYFLEKRDMGAVFNILSRVVKNFYEALRSKHISDELDKGTISLNHKLFRIYVLHTLEREASEFFSSSAVTVRQIQLARTKAVMKLLEEIRPHAVRLVDVWRFPDWQLDSSLVYEDLFRRASELKPLNALTVDPYPNSDVLIRKEKMEEFKSKP
ncbi:MAG: hypothetical protein Q9166_003484 [cf. Caloplaca sp. 2 TL-2023]